MDFLNLQTSLLEIVSVRIMTSSIYIPFLSQFLEQYIQVGGSIYISSVSSPSKKALFTLNCFKGQSKFAADDNNTLIVLILARGAKVSV